MSETKPLQITVEVLFACDGLGEYVVRVSPPPHGKTVGEVQDAVEAQRSYIETSVNAHERLEADSKKLREPATCNAGHKSNLPVALWDCPVCTQLLREQHTELLKQLKYMVRDWIEIVGSEEENRTPADRLEKAKAAIAKAEAGEVQAALKGSPADNNSPEVRRARGAM